MIITAIEIARVPGVVLVVLQTGHIVDGRG